MSIRNVIRSLFWIGQKCSLCKRPLGNVRSGDNMPTRSRRPCTTMKCMQCGALTCEFCQGAGFAMIGGCRKCGGTSFEAFQMWMYLS